LYRALRQQIELSLLMFIYTHIALAAELEKYLQPVDLAAYYLGAVIPDVRYLTGIRRNKTHLTGVEIMALMQRFPHLESFLLGYLIHCEIDLIDLTRLLFAASPLRLLNSLRQLQLAGIFMENHYLQHVSISPPLSFESNEMLEETGIRADHVHQFAQSAANFLAAPSLQAEFRALYDQRQQSKTKARLYLRLIQAFEINPRLWNIIFKGIPAAEAAEKLPEVLLASPALRKLSR
jgi:hypothetical protein